ncbi:uncharacterized protein BJX67DRAFT_330570 [Aspergillus lucknowensis]|uniref:Uncharacterized protein n=1 Tax=Aspergillus lucknowensis TaxID=176173 RepID=A0ABR4M1A9_9EURO
MSLLTDTTSRKPRRFLPEPIETSSRSSKTHQHRCPSSEQVVYSAHPGARGCIPEQQLNELSSPGHASQAETTSCTPPPMGNTNESGHANQAITSDGIFPRRHRDQRSQRPRKFAPQLMETARHSFRPGKDAVVLDAVGKLQTRSLNDDDMVSDPIATAPHVTQESRFSYSSLLRRQEARNHSFRVPDLPAIPSSCSGESQDSASPPFPDSPSTAPRRHVITADPMKKSGDGLEPKFLQYILPFPPDPSENQLKEQALAAFPNEQVHQPVDHFAIDREEEDPPYERCSKFHDSSLNLRKSRRASSADLPSELELLRRHKEEAGLNRRHYLTTRGGRLSQLNRRRSKVADITVIPDDDGWGMDSQVTQLKQATSPPMLGKDLVFPQSLTPATTVCEATGVNSHNDGGHIIPASSGLWSAKPHPCVEYDHDGLWNGTCRLDNYGALDADTLLPGLVNANYGVQANAWKSSDDLLKPAAQRQQTSHAGAHISRDDSNYSEYADLDSNDGFVTQIYNYLSLGYPSVARYYDHELSKVSGVPVAELRADDLNTDAKGHFGQHSFTSGGIADRACMRWTALRLYIREWARQQPRVREVDRYHEAWGVRERKGSWAV